MICELGCSENVMFVEHAFSLSKDKVCLCFTERALQSLPDPSRCITLSNATLRCPLCNDELPRKLDADGAAAEQTPAEQLRSDINQ